MHDWDKPEYQEMIEHLNKASPQNSRKYSGYGLDLSDIDLNYLYENVFNRLAALESLRTVARAADATSDSGVGRLWERRADEYERYNVGGEEMRRMRQALDALPPWVLDTESE